MSSIKETLGKASLTTKFIAPTFGVSLLFSCLCALFVYESMVGETTQVIDKRVSLLHAAVSELTELPVAGEDISKFLENLQSISRSTSLTVVADDPPQVIASTNSSLVSTPLDSFSPEQYGPEIRQVLTEQRPMVMDGVYILPLVRAGERAQPQLRRGVFVIEFVGGETSYYRSRGSMQVGILLVAMAVILSALTFVIYTRFVGIPLQAMKDHIRRIKGGDEVSPIPVLYQDELGDFGNSIQYLIDRFLDDERRNAALLDSVTVGIITISETGYIVYANPSSYRLIGWEDEGSLTGSRLAAVFGEHGDVTDLFRDFLAEWSVDGESEPRLLTIERGEQGKLPVIGQIKPLALADRRVAVLSLTESLAEPLSGSEQLGDGKTELVDSKVAEAATISGEEPTEKPDAELGSDPSLVGEEEEALALDGSEHSESEIAESLDEDGLLSALNAHLRNATDTHPHSPPVFPAKVTLERVEESGKVMGDRTPAAESLEEGLPTLEHSKEADSLDDALSSQGESAQRFMKLGEFTHDESVDESEDDELTEDEVADVILALQEHLQRNTVFDVRQSFKSFASGFAAIAEQFQLEFRHDVRLTVPSFLSGNLQAVRELIELVLPLSAIEYRGSRGIVLEIKLGEKIEEDTFIRFYFAQLLGKQEDGAKNFIADSERVFNEGELDEVLREARVRAEELGGGLSVQKRLDRGAVYELVLPFRLCSLSDFEQQANRQHSEFELLQEEALILARRQKRSLIRAARAEAEKQRVRILSPETSNNQFASNASTPVVSGSSARGIAGASSQTESIPSYPDDLIVPTHARSLLGGGASESEGVELFKKGSSKWADFMTTELKAEVPAAEKATQTSPAKSASPSAEELLRSVKLGVSGATQRGTKRKKPTPEISKNTVTLSREQLFIVEENLPPKSENPVAKSSPLFKKGSQSEVTNASANSKTISLEPPKIENFNRSRVLMAIGPDGTASQPHSLDKAGFDVTTARTGKELLVLLESRLFDVLILDVDFPEVQALETAKQIRSKERLSGGRVPIIALATPTNASRYKKQHPEIDEFVSKPVTDAQIIEKVQQLCRN